MKRIVLFGICLTATFTLSSAQPKAPLTTDDQFFDAINLDYPGLESVKADVIRNDYEAAKHDFVSYLKARTNVKWYFDWRTFGSLEAKKQTYSSKVGEYIKNHLVSCSTWHQFGERIDWSINPTKNQYSEWTWQLSRHSFWVDMGKAYWATGDEKYAKAFVNQMLSWVEDNPLPSKISNGKGSRWRTIETGIRMSRSWPFVFFYFLPSPNFNDEAIIKMVKSMYEHALFLRKFNTSGNWLTMEMDGLFHVGTLFPEFNNASEWQQFAIDVMDKEQNNQFYPDGAQTELAPGYQLSAVGHFIKVVEVARMNSYRLPDEFVARMQAAFDYSLRIMSPSFLFPGVNDSHFFSCEKYMNQGLGLFPDREDFLYAATEGEKGTEPSFKNDFMPWSGWYTMRSGWNSKQDVYSFFEVGPYSEGHSHEDKLSFIIEAYGDRVVNEGGKYAYDTSKWRKYILSARSHNVTRVDGMDQNRGKLARPRNAIRKNYAPMSNRFVNTPNLVFGEGWYNEGFGAKNDSTVTQYCAMAFVRNSYWVLLDVFTPSDNEIHSYDSFFHFNTESYSLLKKLNGIQSSDPATANVAILKLDSKAKDINVICGQEDPEVQGWVPKTDTELYSCRPVATPVFSRKGSGQIIDPYVIVPIRKGENLTVKKIKDVAPNEYVITFSDGESDRIKFSVDNGSLKNFAVNGKEALNTY